MSKFLVIHPVGSEMTLESGTPIAKSIKSHLTADAYWRRSYYVPDKGALFCIWDASSEEAILDVLKKSAPDLPNEGPYKIELDIHSEDFRQWSSKRTIYGEEETCLRPQASLISRVNGTGKTINSLKTGEDIGM